jgi:hypothetical protein
LIIFANETNMGKRNKEDEVTIPDSSTYEWFWQNNCCQRADGIADGTGTYGATL